MLNKKLNYISFDFETTGLDIEKDDAIQFGIVKFDYNFNIIDTFSSYIKPNNLNELSEIVEFTTGIKKDKLECAPNFDEIKNKIESFFDKNSVLIGHNIQFDINFLKKYIKEIPYKLSFDTYIYSRKFFHFEPSYALEILADKYNFYRKSHDALEDALMSMELFKLIIKKIEKIINKYPFLADIILKSNSVFKEILQLQLTNRKIFSIPKRGKNLPKSKKIYSQTKKISDFPNKSVFNVNGITIKDIFSFIINSQQKAIFSFSSNSRVNLFKRLLKEEFIPFGILNNGYITSQENEKKLLSKNTFTDFEAEYIIKNFSHYLEELSILDIVNHDEYKVYKFLSDKKRNISANFLVCTHYELFNFIKENGKDKIKNYDILFFDWHNRANNLGKVINKGFDFYELLSKLDILIYEKKFENNEKKLEKLVDELSTFFGVLFSKLKYFFRGSNNNIELVNLINDTRNGVNTLKESFKNLDKKINILTNQEIIDYWNIFKEAFTHYTIVEQKIFQSGNLKYIFNPLMENIDINTFNEFLEGLNYYNFTTINDNKYIKLKDKLQLENKRIDILEEWGENIDFKLLVENIKKKLSNNESIYIVSNNKNFSNSLFKLIYNLLKEYNLKANLYVENITGGQGKLIYFLLKDKNTKITIGGPEFLIQNIAKNIKYNKIMLLSIGGKNKQLLVNDIKFYLV